MNNFTVDDKELKDALAELNSKKLNKSYRAAIRKSISLIATETRKQLRKSFTGGKNLTVGVKTLIYKNGDGGNVNILPARNVRKGDRHYNDYLLKFFEKGTVERHTRKGYYRGKIGAKWFFKTAIELKRRQAEDMLEENIGKEILKTYKKSKK